MTHRVIISFALLATLTGCDDGRAEIEARNAAYEAKKLAASQGSEIWTPEVTEYDLAKTNRDFACQPEKPGWPVDREACDVAQAKVDELNPAKEQLRQEMENVMAEESIRRAGEEAEFQRSVMAVVNDH